MHPQKKMKELRLKREKYHKEKEQRQQAKNQKNQKPFRLSRTLFRVKKTLSTARSKMSLWKLNFVKKLLSRKDPSDSKDLNAFYKRTHISCLAVDNFFEQNAVFYPGKNGSTTPKKVLTKTMDVLLRDFNVLIRM